ncbi:XkdF-like putative serine protease domain-containing protein [Methanosphaera sp.]
MNEEVTYVKCCVLASELPDFINDKLLRREVKLIFTNTKNLNFDIDHKRKYLSGVEIIENYINQSNEMINSISIPAGSWIMVLAITNNNLRESISRGEIRGVSLRTALGEAVNLIDPTTRGRISYNNIENKEEMQPESISFTANPANEIPFEVMDYEAYTAKNKNKVDNMTNEHESENSFWRKLFSDRFTAKSMAVPQPQSDMGILGTDEFINSMIESQKAIPKTNELIEKLLENQLKTTETVASLQTQIEELQLKIAEKPLQTQSQQEGEEGQVEENPEEAEEQEGEESGEDTNPTYDGEKGATPQTPEDGEEETPEEDPEEKHTAKTGKPQTIIRQTPQNNDMENVYKFIAERSYENLIKQK